MRAVLFSKDILSNIFKYMEEPFLRMCRMTCTFWNKNSPKVRKDENFFENIIRYDSVDLLLWFWDSLETCAIDFCACIMEENATKCFSFMMLNMNERIYDEFAWQYLSLNKNEQKRWRRIFYNISMLSEKYRIKFVFHIETNEELFLQSITYGYFDENILTYWEENFFFPFVIVEDDDRFDTQLQMITKHFALSRTLRKKILYHIHSKTDIRSQHTYLIHICLILEFCPKDVCEDLEGIHEELYEFCECQNNRNKKRKFNLKVIK